MKVLLQFVTVFAELLFWYPHPQHQLHSPLHPSPHYQKSLLCCGSLCHLQKLYLTFSACHAVKARRAIKACVHNLADELSSHTKKVGGGEAVDWEDVLLVLWTREWQLSSVAVKCLPRPQSVEVGSRVSSVCHMLLKRQMFMNYAPRGACVRACVCVLVVHTRKAVFEDNSMRLKLKNVHANVSTNLVSMKSFR